MSRPRVLLTGATGLVGRYLMETAPDEFDLYAFGHRQNLRGLPSIDLSKESSIERALSEVQPDVIINAAGITSIDDAARHPTRTATVNVKAVKLMLAYCEKTNARLIQFSTDFVFEGTKEFYTEQDECRALSTYGQSKREAEEWVLEHSGHHAIVRTSWVYGKHPMMSRSNFLLLVLDKLSKGQKMNITADQLRTPTYGRDLAMGTWAIIDRKAAGIFHLAGPEAMSIMELARRIAIHADLDAGLLNPIQTEHPNATERRPLKTVLSIRRAKTELGYDPLPLEQAMNEMNL